MKTLDLVINQNLFFEIPSTPNDSFAIVAWVITNKTKLADLGFTVQLPNILDKKITTESYALIYKSLEQNNDWFDIKGKVAIGDYQIPFSKFITYIKKNERLFPLDTEEVFIIPIEWMSRYRKLANFGNIKNDSVVLNKSNYTVLQEVLPQEKLTLSITDHQQTTYETSSLLKATLRPYQLEGVQWLVKHYQNGLGACLADDMGLGKTLQTIATLVYAKEQLLPNEDEVQKIQFDLFSSPLEIKTFLKALIVLPSSLVFNWPRKL